MAISAGCFFFFEIVVRFVAFTRASMAFGDRWFVCGAPFFGRLDGRAYGDQNHGLTINTWGFHMILIC
jgi:hypothetical protein